MTAAGTVALTTTTVTVGVAAGAGAVVHLLLAAVAVEEVVGAGHRMEGGGATLAVGAEAVAADGATDPARSLHT